MGLQRVIIGEWSVDARANQISGPDGSVELEPRVMDLLILLAGQPGEVMSKDEIARALWGEVHVNDDALTRTVFKLRKALGDEARNSRYVATVPKRGYRLVADVTTPAEQFAAKAETWHRKALLGTVVLVALFLAMSLYGLFQERPEPADPPQDAVARMLERADGFYAQYGRADNEAALRLYSDALDLDPDNAPALAGLANALTQRQIRYEGPGSQGQGRTTLTQALDSGWLDSETALAALERAVALARRATDIDPSHTRAWRALGLALSAAGEFAQAERAYERALVIDPDDWGTMINLSELYTLMGEPGRSTPYLEQAWAAMERRYATDPVLIRPWHSAVGLSVAQDKLEAGANEEAELWYRRVLTLDPLNVEAVRGLSTLLAASGDTGEATALCADLEQATGETC
ncbi:winged helix-turn-helix domain-containing protein [Maricaulis parjimensis]|uniref:winged helix-turn-helix domain-containing protein n=1 Tax=Maricaulis parjimensis TaxID=144023 RepID=UPI00193A93DE|nr:winged helix-turn-helix domain-containing protein [Maricaulis parjimensis]